jgi:hypothetical protein
MVTSEGKAKIVKRVRAAQSQARTQFHRLMVIFWDPRRSMCGASAFPRFASLHYWRATPGLLVRVPGATRELF